jgi:hypothetical protein
MKAVDRRDFFKLTGIAGVASLQACSRAPASAQVAGDFHFVHISDTHWGFKGPPNPDAEHTQKKAIVTVNGLAQKARLHRLHWRSHPHDRGWQGTPRPHEALQGDRRGAQREGRALPGRRA